MANQILYGFQNLQSVMDQRVSDSNVNVVVAAVQATLAEHERQLNAMRSLFVTNTTEYKERFRASANARLQPLDEQGRARPIRPGGYADVAYPLLGAGTAWGVTWRASKKLTIADVALQTAQQMTADVKWNRDQILGALFTNVDWTFGDDQYGSLTIKPLANNDAQTYSLLTGANTVATDNHFAAQAGAISATDPFQAIYDELVEHPENGGTVISLIPTSNKAATQGLAAFNKLNDPNIMPGSGTDQLVGTLGFDVPGKLFGYHDAGVWLVEWPVLPSDYVISVAAGGEPPLAMREEPEAELQGFRLADTRPDYPFYETQWIRIAGFGARNRVGAHVQRVGNGSYAIPAGYTQPMP